MSWHRIIPVLDNYFCNCFTDSFKLMFVEGQLPDQTHGCLCSNLTLSEMNWNVPDVKISTGPPISTLLFCGRTNHRLARQKTSAKNIG